MWATKRESPAESGGKAPVRVVGEALEAGNSHVKRVLIITLVQTSTLCVYDAFSELPSNVNARGAGVASSYTLRQTLTEGVYLIQCRVSGEMEQRRQVALLSRFGTLCGHADAVVVVVKLYE